MSNHKSVDDNNLTHRNSGDPTEILQNSLDIQVEGTCKDKMTINGTKCHATTSHRNLYGITIDNYDIIKLLGAMIPKDSKWSENTKHICSKLN